MSAHQLIKTVFDQTNRSGFHKLVVPTRHRCCAPEAVYDLLGGGIIVGLSVGTILLVRLILAK